jgi:hypothetical protein
VRRNGMEQRRARLDDGYEPVHWAANYDDLAALSACILAPIALV